MKLHNELPVYKATYDMLLDMHQTYKVYEDLIVNHLAHQSPCENNFFGKICKFAKPKTPCSKAIKTSG